MVEGTVSPSRRCNAVTARSSCMKWHGWYALRRWIATLVNSVKKDAMAANGLLRHASVTTAQKHYIKEVPELTLKSMEKVEALCTDRATAEGGKGS